MNVQCSGGSRGFAKHTRALRMRSAVASHWKLTWPIERIIETDPLTTTQEVAEELNVDHSMVVWHLKQSEKVKNSVSGYLVLLLLLLSRFSRVRLCVTSETAAHQAPPSLGFSKQEHWSRLPFPSPVHESEVTQSCPTLSDPMDCSLPGSSVHGILQARVLEWGVFAFSK